ncbi:DNA polymerase alpha, subunit B [Daedaleopsis nitida]|nr:DNA polymerase alpha, subunit B [Daedaleopsis nitida]
MAATPETLHTDIKQRFGEDLEDNLVSECVKLCQQHNINGEDLFFKWEAVRFSRGPTQFSLGDIQEIKKSMQRDLMKANVAKKFARGNLSGPQSRNFGATPVKTGVRPTVMGTPTPIKPMMRPQDGFDLSRVAEKVLPVAGPSRVAFVGPSLDEESRKKRAYRYMYEKVSERSEVLDDRIDYFGDLVKAYYDVEELGDPAAVTEEEVIVVGRVALDSESSSGPVKLNEASLMLESSRMMGSGVRVPVRFDPEVSVRRGKRGMGGQGFFPGAIVALKGKNGGGGSFLATEILTLPPLQPSAALVKPESGDSHFSMFVVSGPFTSDADLQFRPLQNLISKLKTSKPAVVLLCTSQSIIQVGPFIDTTHPSIKVGDIDATPHDMFRTEFIDRLRDFLDSSPGSIVLLIPSVRDILSDHAVFPQCELSHALCNDPRIHLLPNPARFTINGVHIAASSVDVLFHLRKEELFKRAAEIEPLTAPVDPEGQGPSDAMANLCRHVLQQRNFYPIFPVPLDLAHEVNLDVSHSDLLYLAPEDDEEEEGVGSSADPSPAKCAPDVLVIPSRLKQFSKVVDHTVAINPSSLTKSTYAVLEYAGHTAPGPVRDRLKVEISRLEG